MGLTSERIVVLYKKYSALKKYTDKLSFYDRHFSLIPYSFFPFDQNLEFLNLPKKIDFLIFNFKMESNAALQFKKAFVVDKKTYSFDVTPINSYPLIFNNFIINKFVTADKQFLAAVKKIKKNGNLDGKAVSVLLRESNEMLQFIREYLNNKKERSFRIQFMSVFYQGYSDQLSKKPKTFRFRKKIIELFLYSQGILYGMYCQILKEQNIPAEEQIVSLTDFGKVYLSDWRDQIILLKHLGILDIIKVKLQHPVQSLAKKQFHIVVCQIIGQKPEKSDLIGSYIDMLAEPAFFENIPTKILAADNGSAANNAKNKIK